MADLIAITSAPGWWLLFGEPGKWQRRPLACFAMVADPASSPYVVGMTVPERELVELAEPGSYVHDSEFPRCRCSAPILSDIDHGWCRFCAGTVRA